MLFLLGVPGVFALGLFAFLEGGLLVLPGGALLGHFFFERFALGPVLLFERLHRLVVLALGEIEKKRRLYFEASAEEGWTCSSKGAMRFFGREGEQEATQLAPDFPARVEV